MDTVAKAGGLSTPRLSVTTSEKVTVPEVLGTVTETLDAGAVTIVEGLAGDSATEALTGTGGTGIGGWMMGALGSGFSDSPDFGNPVGELVGFGI